MKIFIVFISLIVLTLSNTKAQAIKWTDGSLVVKEVAEGIYEKQSSESTLAQYEFRKDGSIWHSNVLPNGGINGKMKVAYYEVVDNGKLFFYDGLGGDSFSYYDPNSKQFFDEKDNIIAKLMGNGDVVNSNDQLLFHADTDKLAIEVIGFFVLFRY